MLVKTRGIVINYIKYSESSIIVKIYTEELGLQSYIVSGVRSAKAKNKIALYQPMTLLELVVYYKKNQHGLFRISEVKCLSPFHSIPFNFIKSGVAIFLTEMLSKSLKEETPNPELYAFLFKSILLFDQLEEGYENFHLFFLLKLSKYLGFEPESAGEILGQIEEAKKIIIESETKKMLVEKIGMLIDMDFDTDFKLNHYQRSEIIDILLDFYRLHVAGFDQIKSLIVLREMNK